MATAMSKIGSWLVVVVLMLLTWPCLLKAMMVSGMLSKLPEVLYHMQWLAEVTAGSGVVVVFVVAFSVY